MIFLSWVFLKLRQAYKAGKAHKKAVAIGVGIIVLLSLIGLAYRGCSRRLAKPIDQKAVVELQQAIETKNRAAMEAQAAKYEAKQTVIDNDLDGNLKAAEEAEAKAKQEVRNKSDEELTRYLIEVANR